jgi:hypothetical protein
MNRRSFMRTGLALPGAGRLFGQREGQRDGQGDGWSTFEVTTRAMLIAEYPPNSSRGQCSALKR